jgi:uncharacterized membrane protein SpoIIM required for sporulation
LKETRFIEENKEKWNRFERLYESKSNDPEELSDLYMDITDDLSFAQTFYKRRTVRVYLNQLGQKVYTGVHKQKGESFKKFFTVWRTSLPLEIYRSRKNLLFALVAFLIYSLIGVVTTYIDPDFPRTVMGDGYVDMTLENIQNGNPLAVYESSRQMDMFIGITTNNMRVAFLTFFVGFFFTVGTHMIMFSNGVMLGSFQYFFYTKGLLVTSFLGIWIHGAFEISAIVLAGGAGITAGNGLLFPGSYTRMQSLQLSTKRGLKIMLSLVPFIIAAGFLESFVTANYQVLPNWSKWALIILSFAIILFFYVFYPMYVARKHPELLHKEEVPNFQKKQKFNLTKIRNVGDIVADSIRMYRRLFGRFMRINLLIIFPIIAVVVYLQDVNHYDLQQTQYWYDWAAQLEFMMGYCFINMQDYVVFGVWTFIFALMFTTVLWAFKTVDEEKFSWRSFFGYVRKRYLVIWIANFLLCFTVLVLPWYYLMIALFLIPLFYLNAAAMGLGDESFKVRWSRGFKYSSKQYASGLLTILILFVLVFMAVQPIAFFMSFHQGITNEPVMPDLLDVAANFVKRVAMIYTDDYMIWPNIFRQFIYIFAIFMIIPLLVITMAFGYYNELEKNEAKGLNKVFERFGKRSRSKETDADFD